MALAGRLKQLAGNPGSKGAPSWSVSSAPSQSFQASHQEGGDQQGQQLYLASENEAHGTKCSVWAEHSS